MSLPISDNATITMSMHEYRTIEREYERMQVVIEELKTRGVRPLEAADTAQWRDALCAALPVVQFAVGNLNPESVRDWPWSELAVFAKAMPGLFPDDPDRQSLAITFEEFAREAAKFERFREHRFKAAQEIIRTAPDVDPVDAIPAQDPATSTEAAPDPA